MGYSRYSPKEWTTYSTETATKSTAEIFKESSMNPDLDPKDVIRESRDSDLNPKSNAIIIACDVTGSMGMIAENLVRKGIGTLFQEIIDRKPVSDPHLMIMGIGDADMNDEAPIQVSQFESDLTIMDQLEKIYVEGNGGGNQYESYDLPAYYAAFKTSIDCFEKRGKKGYLFTIGDEPPPPMTHKDNVKRLFGDSLQADMPYADVIAAAERMYNVYHIIIKEGWYAMRHLDAVKSDWSDLLGQRAIVLTDHTKLSEVIVSTIEVNEGRDAEEVIKSWGGDTSLVVKNAVSGMTAADAFDAANKIVDL
jgi:hypothetical protein